jgi:hypothetical protein
MATSEVQAFPESVGNFESGNQIFSAHWATPMEVEHR